MKEYLLPLRRRFVLDRDNARMLIEWYKPYGRGWSLYLWARKRDWGLTRTLGGWCIDIGPLELFWRR